MLNPVALNPIRYFCCYFFILLCLETVCLPQDVFSLLEPPASISSGCNVLSLAVLEGCVYVCVCLLMNADDSVSRSVRKSAEVQHGRGVCGYRATLVW